jgi:hypothetical protein
MRRLLALGAGALVVLVLGIGQLVLPGIAASMLRDRLARSGRVLAVSVSAFPAVELLWHSADKVVVRLASYRSDPGHLTSLLDEAGSVGTLDASVQTLDTGLLTLHDASLHKRGNRLLGSAQVSEADLRTALPFLQSVTFVSSRAGALTLRGTASLAVFSASIDATVHPDAGKLVVSPQVPLLGSIAAVTVFSDPRVRVESVSGAPTAGGLSVSAQGVFR